MIPAANEPIRGPNEGLDFADKSAINKSRAILYAGVSLASAWDDDFALGAPRALPRALPCLQARNGSKEPRFNDPMAAMTV